MHSLAKSFHAFLSLCSKSIIHCKGLFHHALLRQKITVLQLPWLTGWTYLKHLVCRKIPWQHWIINRCWKFVQCASSTKMLYVPRQTFLPRSSSCCHYSVRNTWFHPTAQRSVFYETCFSYHLVDHDPAAFSIADSDEPLVSDKADMITLRNSHVPLQG